MSTRTVLITGGSGMVGRNIQEHPLVLDWDVIAPSHFSLDLTNAAAVGSYIEKTKPSLIIHCAGRVGGIQANMANPIDFLQTNVAIGNAVIMGAYTSGVPHLLNLASTCMYPRDASNPLTEDLILTGALEPTNEGYALAKIMATRLCQYIRKQAPKFQYKTLIPCNLYGRYDKFDPRHSHLIPAVMKKIYDAKVQGLDEVEIWGDGSARREFMYAGDLAGAVVQAAESIEQLPDLMNIGLGIDHTINDYYEAIANIIGWNGNFVHDLSKPVGMKRKLCSTAQQTAWGWSPKVTLEQGLKQTYDFFLEESQT